MKITKRQEKLFKFLQEKYKLDSTFSIIDACQATGYKESTIETYFRKKLNNHIVKKEIMENYRVQEKIMQLDFEKFLDCMTQTNEECR